MPFSSITGAETLRKFLDVWPLESLKTMTIEKYADLSDHQSYCYWLEYGSRDLGEIGGMPLTKFGLWRYKEYKDFTDTYESDSVYAWNGKFGKQRMLAFKNIIAIVAEIAAAASAGDWQRVEDIDFHAVAKWKIAFMYSSERLVPVYTREGLLKIAAGLGGRFAENATFLSLQLFVKDKKPAEMGMVAFAEYLWMHYVKGKTFRNYFIVGSKYKDDEGSDSKDVFPEMLATNSIAIGFLYNVDCSRLTSASEEEIKAFVAANSSGETIELSKLQSYFRILFSLKPGDIVAVKAHGSFNNLSVIAYAVVTEKNGRIYEYKPEQLGHHVNVEFVELGIDRRFTYNYAGTIHHISSERPDHLKAIFGPFLQVDDIALGSEADDDLFHRGDTTLKSEEAYQRGEIASRMIRQLHNILQNSFFKFLQKKFPGHKLTMEYERRVDIVREYGNERWFYEIKPFENVVSCLREASGQLIEYAYRFQDGDKTTHLVIVGPGELKGEAMGFFDHYAAALKLSFQYEQHVPTLRQDM